MPERQYRMELDRERAIASTLAGQAQSASAAGQQRAQMEATKYGAYGQALSGLGQIGAASLMKGGDSKVSNEKSGGGLTSAEKAEAERQFRSQGYNPN